MKKDKLTDAIGLIKDEFVAEAHEPKKKKLPELNFSWALTGKVLTGALALFLVISIIPNFFHKAATGGNYYAASDSAYYDYGDYEASEAMQEKPAANGSDTSSIAETLQNSDKKLILTSNLELEVSDLDALYEKVTALTQTYGGYVQNSSISSRNSTRYYNATIRIPANAYSSFIADLKDEGQQLSYSETVDDITDSYTDLQARLTSLRAQEEKVREFYSKAESIEDLMSVEQRLSEIRYEIEYLDAQIRNYDLLTSYSTLHLNASETRIYTPENNSFLTRLKNAFINGFNHFFNSVGDFFLDVVYNIWMIILLAVIAYVVYRIWKKRRNKKQGN